MTDDSNESLVAANISSLSDVASTTSFQDSGYGSADTLSHANFDDAGATELVAGALSQQNDLRESLTAAFTLDPDKFGSTLVTLLRRFAAELSSRAVDEQGKIACRFIRSRAGSLSWALRSHLGFAVPRSIFDQLHDQTIDAKANIERLLGGRHPIKSEADLHDIAADSDSEASGTADLAPNIARVERFLFEGEPFKALNKRVQRHVKKISNGMPLPDSVEDLEFGAFGPLLESNEVKDTGHAEVPSEISEGLTIGYVEKIEGAEIGQSGPLLGLDGGNSTRGANDLTTMEGDFDVGYIERIRRWIMEPRLKVGLERVRWTCPCGSSLFDDYAELVPGAAKELEIHLRKTGHRSQTERASQRGALLLSRSGKWVSRLIKSVFQWTGQSRQRGFPTNETELGGEDHPQRPQQARFLLLCLNLSKIVPQLKQPPTCGVRADRDFFRLLRYHYNERSLFVRTLFSLKTVTQIRFVQVRSYSDLI